MALGPILILFRKVIALNVFNVPDMPRMRKYLLLIHNHNAADAEVEESNNEVCDHKKREKAASLRKSKFGDGLVNAPNGQVSAAAGSHELQMLNNSVTLTAATPT